MSNEGGDATGDVSQVKEDWGDIYVAPSPMPYFHVMTPTDYGRYHDQFLHIFEKELLQEFDIQKSLKVVEFGTSYGNTTLAYKCGMDWQTVGSVWNDDTVKLIVVRDIYVTAVDKSVEALNYGLKRGIFDEIVPFDFNTTPLPTVMTALNDADLLVMIMVSFYTRTNTYMKTFFNFLGDRKKKKVIAYNHTHAFEPRNITPECLFAGVKGWKSTSYFTKHRNFTEIESAAHFGAKESWCTTYIVTFEPLESDML